MSKKRYYIAYGSNLSIEQMAFRCPTAKVVGTAMIEGYALIFKTHATIEPDENRKVPVAIWEIQPEDEKRLDMYEGYPVYYYKADMTLPVKMAETGETRMLTAMVYIMDEKREVNKPFKEYYLVLEEGYTRFGFDQAILQEALEQSIEKTKGGRKHGIR